MSKKRGLSIEDKRKGMMEIFYEKKDFFQLKELEKIAPKEKGIVQGTVKDVIQGLVDDGMVDTDKIGTSVYFWAFPSKAANTKKQKLVQLETRQEEVKRIRMELEKKLEVARAERKDEGDRDQLMAQLSEAKKINEALKSKLKQSQEVDPEVLEQLKGESTTTVTAVNRWTDNIFNIKSWCKNKFSMEESALDKNFGIPADMDYL